MNQEEQDNEKYRREFELQQEQKNLDIFSVFARERFDNQQIIPENGSSNKSV